MTSRDRIEPHPVLRSYYPDRAQRKTFVSDLFDRTAPSYDAVSNFFSFGSGDWYRRRSLAASGMREGHQVLDVAVGTGLVARQAIALTRDAQLVTGLDASAGMLAEAQQQLGIGLIHGSGEQLPIADASVDFVTVGYALRHFADLRQTFLEFRRVLRPGGRLVILEIARPTSSAGHAIARLYLGRIVPALSRVFSGKRSVKTLMQYYWDTIEHCVPPHVILETMRECEFTVINHSSELGVFKLYCCERTPN